MRLPLLSTVHHCQHMRKFDQICLLQYKFPLSLFYLNRKFVYSPNLWVLQLSWNLQRATVHNVLMQCFMREHLRVSRRLPVS